MPEEPEFNPYTPPVAEVLPATNLGTDEGLVPATNGKRFLNYVIDQVAFYSLPFGIGYAVMTLDQVVPAAWLLNWLEEDDLLANITFSIMITIIYYFGMEALCGRTLGKIVTGTKVVSLDGRKPTLGQLLGRSLSRLVPFEPFSFLWGSSSGWHDRWSKTLVIDLRADPDYRLAPALRKFYR